MIDPMNFMSFHEFVAFMTPIAAAWAFGFLCGIGVVWRSKTDRAANNNFLARSEAIS